MRNASLPMTLAALLALSLSVLLIMPTPRDAGASSSIAGSWELSNAARNRRCTVMLSPAPTFAVRPGDGCSTEFPFVSEVRTWKAVPPVALQLLGAGGAMVAEFTAVEDGLYEGERPSDGILFMQNLASRAAEERSPAQVSGNWTLLSPRGGLRCGVTLSTLAAVEPNAYSLSLRPGCDATVARFNPVAWRFDRGQLLILAKTGETWRFEEADTITWHRVPAGRQPLHLVRD